MNICVEGDSKFVIDAVENKQDPLETTIYYPGHQMVGAIVLVNFLEAHFFGRPIFSQMLLLV